MVDLQLPASTRFDKFVAKTNLYKQAAITPKIHDLIEKQIERMTWVNKIAPTTMNITSGDVLEFQVFDIQLKNTDLDNTVLIFIQKSVPYPLLFALHGARGVRVVAVIKGADSKPIILATEWRTSLTLTLSGITTDAIYKNYLQQLSDIFDGAGGDAKKYSEIVRLKRAIEALNNKIRKETQINKRQELARQRYELELQLKELVG